MIWLYPRPWRLTRLQAVWAARRDLRPWPLSVPVPWWRRVLSVGRGTSGSWWFFLNLGVGALRIVWRREAV